MLQLSQSFQRYIGLLLVKLTSLVVEYFSFVLSLDWFNVFWLKWLVTCNTWAAVTKSLFCRRSLNVVQLAYPQLNIQPNEVVFSNATYFEFCFDNFKAFWSIESFFLTLGKSLSLECLNGLISQTQPFDLIRICSRQIVHNRYQNVNLAEQEILKYWKSIKFCPPPEFSLNGVTTLKRKYFVCVCIKRSQPNNWLTLKWFRLPKMMLRFEWHPMNVISYYMTYKTSNCHCRASQ